MGVITGLTAINEILEKPKSNEQYQKVTWLKLADGEGVSVRFPNELDQDSPNFSEDRGPAVVISEHTNPKDYRIKAACSQEEDGRCFACELHIQENRNNNTDYRGGWKARYRFYTNVIVDDGTDTYPAVWSQGLSNKSAFQILKEQSLETGSISNVNWKMKRNGVGTETSYTLIPSAPDSEPHDWGSIELFNLEQVVRQVPYAEQEAFYLGFDVPGSGPSASNKEEKVSSSLDW